MASFFKSFAKKETLVSVHKPEEFKMIDNQDFVRDQNVVTLARQAVRLDMPAESATRPDANELNIIKKLEDLYTQATMRVNKGNSILQNMIAGLDISQEVAEVNQIGEKYAEEIQAEFGSDLSELIKLEDRAIEVKDEIIEFKKANNIQHSATYKKSIWLTVGVLLMAVVVESWFNSMLFAQGSDFGLVGGIYQAAIISILNISLGFVAGLWPYRFKNHNNSKIAYLNLAIFIGMLGFMVMLNFLVGHYREALILDPDNAEALALQSFQAGILSFTDVQSWFLAIIGGLACLLAIYEGYTRDDPYPGYGKLDRKYHELHDEFIDAKGDTWKKLDKFHEDYLDRSVRTVEAIREKNDRHNNYISTLREQNELLVGYINHLDNVGKYAITLYRETNEAMRTTPTPEYFKDPIHTKFKTKSIETNFVDNSPAWREAMETANSKLPNLQRSFIEARDDFRNRITKVVEK